MLGKHLWLIVVSLILSIILLNIVGSCVLEFKNDAFTLLPGMLSGYLLISILLERFIGGVFLREKKKQVDNHIKSLNQIKKEKSELLTLSKIPIRTDQMNLGSIQAIVSPRLNNLDHLQEHKENELAQARTTRNESFDYYAFFLGLILSAVGFRFFTKIVEVEQYKECIKGDSYDHLITGVDIFLTAILFAGGSKLILELIERFKND